MSFIFDFDGNLDVEVYNEITLDNDGDIEIYPIITVKMYEDGSFSLENTTTDKELLVENLSSGETVEIDNENEIITTDVTGTYRYDDHNGVFMRFDVGENDLVITGECILGLEYRYRYLK